MDVAKWMNFAVSAWASVFAIYFVGLIVLTGVAIRKGADRANALLVILVPLHFAWVIPLTLYAFASQIKLIAGMFLLVAILFALLLAYAWISGVIERRRKR